MKIKALCEAMRNPDIKISNRKFSMDFLESLIKNGWKVENKEDGYHLVAPRAASQVLSEEVATKLMERQKFEYFIADDGMYHILHDGAEVAYFSDRESAEEAGYNLDDYVEIDPYED